MVEEKHRKLKREVAASLIGTVIRNFLARKKAERALKAQLKRQDILSQMVVKNDDGSPNDGSPNSTLAPMGATKGGMFQVTAEETVLNMYIEKNGKKGMFGV